MSSKTLGFDLFLLAQACAREARHIDELLSMDITREAQELLSEGFIIPAPQVLEHAAHIFREVGNMPGHGSALGQETIQQRLDLICAFANALFGMEREIDLTWSNNWMLYLEGAGKDTSTAAIKVLNAWNAGERINLLEILKADRDAAYSREVWNR